MNFIVKIVCFVVTVLSSTSAFALIGNRLDVLGFGGYSQASGFSDTTASNIYGNMTGFNGGGMLLITLVDRMLAPVIGVGGDYMQLKSSVTYNGAVFDNTLTSAAGTGHAGVRIVAPMVRLFLLGNAGYGSSDKIVTNIEAVGGGATLSTMTMKLKSHMFYGATAALMVSAAPFVKVGVSAVYNTHNAKLEDESGTSNDTTYQELSGNLVIGISL
ncbi:MAG: hypothetical protein V4591_01210 [Bdellovibrionota bacterium]